ncbi:hypothetical protein NUW54_g14468 [Trametes sanguinea]|uniref:Uncharacterized protein n=1 Tax=Trametes sanguinea TaxID=158606 RepID=A0ACC1MC15_9APHY|nr:hypothetical protein NUW54_g14468 [Trametes sanguinea]
MSPYREDFVKFTPTADKPLNAANQQQFHAKGVGEMVIPVPNPPSDDSRIKLSGVLYTPSLGFNLISVGRIDDAGCTATFAGGECVILNPDGQTMGCIPKSRGLYVVVREREPAAANAASDATEELTEDEAHFSRRMHNTDFSHLPPSPSSSSIQQFLKQGVSGNASSATSSPLNTHPHLASNVAHSLLRGTQEGWSDLDDQTTMEALRKLDGLSSKTARARSSIGGHSRVVGGRRGRPQQQALQHACVAQWEREVEG